MVVPKGALDRRRLLAGIAGAAVLTGTGDGAASPAGGWPARHLSFGWLPGGYRAWAYALDLDRESLTAAVAPGGPADPNQFAQLTAYAPGVAPPPGDPTGIRLRWRYAPGSWAVLDFAGPEGAGPAGADATAAARRIASGTRYGRPVPVRLPVRVRGLPAGLPLCAVDGYDPGPADGWAFTLTYGQGARPADPATPYPSLVVDVQAMNDQVRAAMDDPALGARTTVDGHPARRDVQPGTGTGYQDQLQVWNVGGLRVAVTVTGTGVRDLLRADAVAVYRSLVLLPHRVNWT